MQLPIEAPATVFDAFARAATRHGDKPFLAVLPETAQAYGIAAGEISYREALARISALREAYRAKGYGVSHRVGILMEPIEGEWITRWCRRKRAEAGPMFERLRSLVGQIHARGVAHIDLRKRDNILVSEDGRPCIIDFNASFCFDPAGPGARLLFPMLRRIDDSALLKWKSRLAPELLTEAEAARHRLMSRLRRLWIFN